ncbi:MAG TPA: ABC transporter ATP-binding protein [Myxococcota bacterium]|nr:ABC transporter ATP-binding protein [Myxococcota bacterium]
MSDPIIRAHGLTKKFGDFTAVDALDHEVERGSIVAFLGANGAGKSTTIRMLIGLLEPTAGSIEVDGVDVIREPRRVRDRIGYMGQKVSLYHGLTLRENVDFYGGLQGLTGAALDERWAEVRERFALAEAERERPEDLSAGLRQRAGLALATLHRPRLLFLDEPTAGVDVESRALFWERIQDEADSGVTVFVTTHFLEEVDACDRASFIDAGRLLADATPDALRARWSDGYGVEARVAPAERPRAEAALRAAGFDVLPAGDDPSRLALRREALDDTALARLREALGAGASDVRIEQADMNAVFHRAMLEATRRAAA